MLIDRLIFKKHLEEGESVLFAAHKHWTQFLPSFLRVAFFGFLLPWIFYYAGFKGGLFFLLIAIWLFLALVRLLYDWIDWYSDTWLFTNMSVIVVEWQGIFSNTSRRVGYEDIEGLSFEIKGFFGTIMRFGDITLSVISGAHASLKSAKQPKKVELALMKHQGDYLNSRNLAQSDGLKDLISQMVAHHLRRKK